MRKVFYNSVIIACLILLQAVLAMAIWTALEGTQNPRYISRGVKINGVPVGGLTAQQAGEKLKSAFGAELIGPLVIRDGEQSIAIQPQQIDARLDYREAIKKAFTMRQQNDGLTGAIKNLALLTGVHDIPLTLLFNHDKAADELAELKRQVDTAPRSATLLGNETNRLLVPEKNGRRLNMTATIELMSALQPPLPAVINAVTVSEPAQITAGDLEPLHNILGECETGLEPDQVNRTANIALAVGALNNTLVKPGQVFSFNEQVGKRSADNGYLNAPVIDGTTVVQGLGGGVCQVSSTLYNALLTANMEIVERQPHTRPVGYVSPGLDATVADEMIDLRFRNNRKHPVLITGNLEKDSVTVRLWGVMSDNEPPISIETELQIVSPKTIIRRDANLPRGEQLVQSPGRRGYEAVVYQVIRGSYGETRKHVSRDYYPPENRVIVMGAMEPEPTK